MNYNNNGIDISIIMPIRNTPVDILEECIDSVLSQSFNNFELICVDDGSTEKMVIEKLKSYNEKYQFVSVIRNTQSVGAGAARNIGLKKAIGKYVIFFDSDDIYMPDFLEKMFNKAEKEKADVCVCGYSIFSIVNGKKNFIQHMNIDRDLNKNIDRDILYRIGSSPTIRLCRRDYLIEENICFPTLSSDEDEYYGCMVILSTDRISFLHNELLFHYRVGTDFQRSNNMDPFNFIAAINMVKKDIAQRKIYKTWYNELIDTHLIMISNYEMKMSVNPNLAKKYYDYCRNYFISNNIHVSTRAATIRLEKWKALPYESRWFDLIEDYNSQLELEKDEILNVLYQYENIYVWGIGKRAYAFFDFAIKYSVNILGACDRANTHIGENNEFGITILSTEDVVQKDGLIIASNSNVYNSLHSNNEIKCSILNLEEYCPL